MAEITKPSSDENSNPLQKFPNRFFIIPVLLVGLILRIINISKYSLWSDEAGQVYTALLPRFEDFLDFISRHVMAMPLDYAITRLMVSMSLDEGFLRLPAVIWGVLAILFLFLSIDTLFRNHKGGRIIALLTALFLAVSPVHIFYSQEIRFYSALICFFWLSNFLLLRYLVKPKLITLILFSFTCLIGVFFHPYIYLVFVNSGLFIIFSRFFGFNEIINPDGRIKMRVIGGLAISAGIILFCFFTWFFYQQPNSNLNYELFRYTGTFFNFLLSGTGWRGYEWCANSTLFGPWEFFLSMTFAVGVFLTTRDKKFLRMMFPIILAYFLQTALIVAADFTRGYWVAMRQIIHLTPMLFILNAFTIYTLIEWISNRKPRQRIKGFSKATLLILSTLIIFAFAAPKIFEYYNVGKSNARQIIESMLKSRPEVNQILIYPGYDSITYELYLDKYYKIRDTKIVRIEINNLSEFIGQEYFLITQVQLTEEEIRQINQYSTLVYMSETRCFGDRGLFFSK